MAVSAPDHYEVRWRQTGTVQWGEVSTIKPTDEIVVEGLDRAKTYDFEVRAVAACGAKSAWVTGSHAPASNPVPLTITSITASSLADGVHLAWTIASNAPAGIEYSVERSANGTTGWTARTSVRALAYTDPETSGTTYYYRVRAVNFAGDFGTYSPIVDSHGVSVAGIGADATAALADAAAAQADADAANYELANIASDNILSQGEKPPVINDYNVIVAEQAGIDAQATAYAITTEKTAYDGKVTALTSYLATLTTPTLWSNLAGDTTIVGTTFRTKFADVYTTRQTLLNAIYAGAKAKADAAQGTANNAAPAYVINPGFDLLPAGIGWVADYATWYPRMDSVSPGVNPGCAERVGSSGTPTDVYRNSGKCFVIVGQQYKAQALVQALGANGACRVRISWRDASDSEASLTASYGNPITGSTTAGSYVVAPAPAGAVYAHVEVVASAHTTGAYRVDNVVSTLQPSSVGEVPDGGGRYAVNQVDSNGLAIIDFSQPGQVNKSLKYVADDVGSGRYAAAQVGADKTSSNTASDTAHVNGATAAAISDGAGRAQAGFDSSGYLVSGRNNLDLIANSATYLRSVARSQGLVENGDFEIGGAAFPPPGWQPGAVVTGGAVTSPIYDTTGPYSGTRSFGFTSAPNNGYESVRTYSVTPGDWYAIGAASAAGSGGSAAFVLYYLNAASAVIGSLLVTKTPSGFGYSTKTGQVPTGAVAAKLALVNLGTSSAVSEFDALFMARCSSYDNALAIASSGTVLGNQYNAPNSLTMTYGAAQSTTSLSATSAGAVSVAAFIVYTGSVSASYSAVSNAVTGLTVGSSYYIYCHDAGGAGGTKTWYAAASVQLAMQQGDDVVFAGKITIPASGTSGGGGTGCPVREAWVIRKTPDGREYCHAGDVQIGDELLLADMRWGYVSHSQAELQPCVRVVGECGKSLSCSESAPLGLIGGGSVLAPDSAGEVIRTKRDGGESDCIDRIEYIGRQWVQHITCEDDYFWTGDEQDCLFSHHNMKPP